jgi:hypothetical protein
MNSDRGRYDKHDEDNENPGPQTTISSGFVGFGNHCFIHDALVVLSGASRDHFTGR